MPPTDVNERSALLPGAANSTGAQRSYHDDIDKEEPTYAASARSLAFGNPINIMLIAVPLSFASHFAGWGSTADFVISFIALVPLAAVLGDATEQCALKLGQTLGGLLNATFGNAVEAIVGILALVKGELRIVQTSMLGSILSNILLVLGCSFLAAGFRFSESTFQATAAQTSSSLMVLATATLVIPAAYHSQWVEGNGKGDTDAASLLTISRGTSIILFLMYITYLFFQLRSHAFLFEAEESDEEEHATMNVRFAMGALLATTIVTSFVADYLVGAIDEFAADFGIGKAFIGMILLPIVGNAAEHVTSVWMAMKGKMELTIGVCVGSSIQIAIGVIPLLVLIGWGIGQPLSLYFENFETICLLLSCLLVYLLLADGKANYLEGLMLVALYVIIALAVWTMP